MAQSERDRAQRFIFNQIAYEESLSGDDEEDIELSLGLSSNGRFGVDPRAKKLCRSSSIPDFVSPARENGTGLALPYVSCSNLIRTSSLPTETDEQWRKEMQMLRRKEAKGKRSEKQRNSKALKERSKDFEEITSCEEIKKENGNQNPNGFSSKSPFTAPSSQGSIGLQGSGSSGNSESAINPVQGMNKKNMEARSPVSVQSLSECEHKCPKSTVDEKAVSRPVGNRRAGGNPNGARNMMEEMPCVTAKGDGPNGRRIQGFLYRYRKGEEVRIVCVCHGSFLTPAEFVKHAGGGHVTHPLKHILVNPYPLL